MQKESELLYREWNITFAEIPDETTLCVTIPNCPHRCKGCHSRYLQTNSGNPFKEIIDVIKDYKDSKVFSSYFKFHNITPSFIDYIIE